MTDKTLGEAKRDLRVAVQEFKQELRLVWPPTRRKYQLRRERENAEATARDFIVAAEAHLMGHNVYRRTGGDGAKYRAHFDPRTDHWVGERGNNRIAESPYLDSVLAFLRITEGGWVQVQEGRQRMVHTDHISPTGRLRSSGPNPQGINPKTPEAARIRKILADKRKGENDGEL